METYIVQEGDTIVSIARKYNIRVVDLIDANNLGNSYFLTPGLELIIPLTIPNGLTYYTVKKGDNLYQISQKYGLTAKELADLNGLEIDEYIYPDQKLLIPQDGFTFYITKEGDRLNDLANNLNIMKEELILHNPNMYLLPDQIISYRTSNETNF